MNRKLETPRGQPWSQSQLYEIRFKGDLNRRRAQMVERLSIVQEPCGETVPTGLVTDQAALQRILSRIHNLGVPPLSARRLSPEEDSTERT